MLTLQRFWVNINKCLKIKLKEKVKITFLRAGTLSTNFGGLTIFFYRTIWARKLKLDTIIQLIRIFLWLKIRSQNSPQEGKQINGEIMLNIKKCYPAL